MYHVHSDKIIGGRQKWSYFRQCVCVKEKMEGVCYTDMCLRERKNTGKCVCVCERERDIHTRGQCVCVSYAGQVGVVSTNLLTSLTCLISVD